MTLAFIFSSNSKPQYFVFTKYFEVNMQRVHCSQPKDPELRAYGNYANTMVVVLTTDTKQTLYARIRINVSGGLQSPTNVDNLSFEWWLFKQAISNAFVDGSVNDYCTYLKTERCNIVEKLLYVNIRYEKKNRNINERISKMYVLFTYTFITCTFAKKLEHPCFCILCA